MKEGIVKSSKEIDREQGLQARIEALEDFIENAAIPLHWVNSEGRIVWANKAELECLGYTQEEYIGRHIAEFHADKKIIEDILNRLVNKETLINYEARLKCKDGSIKEVLINSNVLWDKDKFIHTRCFTRDVTEIKDLQRKKDEFIAAASHELKTPLTNIKAYIQLLTRTIQEGDPARTTIYLEKTNSYIDKLNNLIAKMLDLTKIQEGKFALNCQHFNFDTLIGESVDSIRYTVNHNIIKTGTINRQVWGDEQALEQVLINLLSNAAKFSPEKTKILVQVSQTETEVIVSVQDSGIGIPKEKHEKIFERFYRIQDQKKFQGLGIGLYISSQIIIQHGGKMWVESEEGKGSAFFFKLPLEAGIACSKSGLKSDEDISPDIGSVKSSGIGKPLLDQY